MTNRYTVTIRKRFPAHDERDGIVYDGIEAKSKSEAIAVVRRRSNDDGHTGAGCGAATISATLEANDESTGGAL